MVRDFVTPIYQKENYSLRYARFNAIFRTLKYLKEKFIKKTDVRFTVNYFNYDVYAKMFKLPGTIKSYRRAAAYRSGSSTEWRARAAKRVESAGRDFGLNYFSRSALKHIFN